MKTFIYKFSFSPLAVADILLRQNVAKILVGDPHQQIYGFRGATNAMGQIDATHVYYLTQVLYFYIDIILHIFQWLSLSAGLYWFISLDHNAVRISLVFQIWFGNCVRGFISTGYS